MTEDKSTCEPECPDESNARSFDAMSFLASQPANPELSSAVQQAKTAGISPLTILTLIWANRENIAAAIKKILELLPKQAA